MTFDELGAFLAVVEDGSFLSAAERLGVSRTTLRRQVDALEARTGTPLLHRNRSGVVLTEAGRALVRGGSVVRREFDTLLRAIRETGRRASGQVRVVLPVGLPPAPLALIHGLIRSSWPEVQVHVRVSDAPLADNLDGVDVVMWFGDGAPRGEWEVRTAYPSRQRLLATRAYLAARGVPGDVEALGAHDLLCWITPDEPEPALVTLSGTRLPVQATLSTSDAHLLHECAHLGRGIAWVPDAGVPVPLERDPLVPVLAELIGRDLPLRVAIPSLLAQVPKVRLFIDHLESMRSVVFGGT